MVLPKGQSLDKNALANLVTQGTKPKIHAKKNNIKKQMFQKTNPKLLWLQQAEKILQVETDSGLAGNRSLGQSFKIQ